MSRILRGRLHAPALVLRPVAQTALLHLPRACRWPEPLASDDA